MNKKLIRLTESDLHRIVKESVSKLLMEYAWPNNAVSYEEAENNFEALSNEEKEQMSKRAFNLIVFRLKSYMNKGDYDNENDFAYDMQSIIKGVKFKGFYILECAVPFVEILYKNQYYFTLNTEDFFDIFQSDDSRYIY